MSGLIKMRLDMFPARPNQSPKEKLSATVWGGLGVPRVGRFRQGDGASGGRDRLQGAGSGVFASTRVTLFLTL
jgi:hypothetical protein